MTETVTEARFPEIRRWFFQALSTEQRSDFFVAVLGKGAAAEMRGSTELEHKILRGIFASRASQPVEPTLDSEAVERVRAFVELFDDIDAVIAGTKGDPLLKVSDLRALLSLANPVGGETAAAALEAGERFLNACTSAWACGEPAHRVKTMLDRADEFSAALTAMKGNGDA